MCYWLNDGKRVFIKPNKIKVYQCEPEEVFSTVFKVETPMFKT